MKKAIISVAASPDDHSSGDQSRKQVVHQNQNAPCVAGAPESENWTFAITQSTCKLTVWTRVYVQDKGILIKKNLGSGGLCTPSQTRDTSRISSELSIYECVWSGDQAIQFHGTNLTICQIFKIY